MPPTVSVVVPTFNASALLRETLATVFAQTFADFEVVVVDDGSTDDTPQVLAEIADPRLRVVRQPNAGIGNARNRGIDESRGTYVALLDHDDLWHPEKLADQVAFLQANPECVACCTPWCKSDRPGVPVVDPARVADEGGIVHDPIARLAEGHDFLITSCLMFDRQRAAGLRYATRPRCIEDTPFQLGLFARGAFGIAGGGIRMTYRVHVSGYSRQAAFFYNGQRLLRELAASGAFEELDERSLQAFLAYTGRTAVVKAIRGGERAAAASLLWEEFPHQLRARRFKFLVFSATMLVAPRQLIRRLGGH